MGGHLAAAAGSPAHRHGGRCAGARRWCSERPRRVATVLEHQHGREGGVGEATDRVTASRNSSDSGSRPNASPPSNVRVCSSVVTIGAVRLVRSGRRLVPENFGMTPSSLLWVWLLLWSFRSGNRANERCRVERRASRRFMPNEGSPSFAADRSEDDRPENQSDGGRKSNARTVELRPEGRRDSSPRPLDPEGTPACASGRSVCRDIDGCEATVRTRTSWFRARRGTSSTTSHCVWTGGLEPPTPGSRSRCAPVAPRPGGTDGRIRTDTDGCLSAVPLPLGYVSVSSCAWTRRESNPQPSPCKGAVASVRNWPVSRGSGNRTRVQGV